MGPGVFDIHSPRIPCVEELVNNLQEMLKKLDADKLWVNPDCGLNTRGMPETCASLNNMIKAVYLSFRLIISLSTIKSI